jgi:hypothetical protein
LRARVCAAHLYRLLCRLHRLRGGRLACVAQLAGVRVDECPMSIRLWTTG